MCKNSYTLTHKPNVRKCVSLSHTPAHRKNAFRDFWVIWVHLDWHWLSVGKTSSVSLLHSPKTALWGLLGACACVTLIVRASWPTPEAFYLSRKVYFCISHTAEGHVFPCLSHFPFVLCHFPPHFSLHSTSSSFTIFFKYFHLPWLQNLQNPSPPFVLPWISSKFPILFFIHFIHGSFYVCWQVNLG